VAMGIWSASHAANEFRVLVFARNRDSALIREVLQRAGLKCQTCRTGEETLAEIVKAAGAVIVAEEMFSPPLITAFANLILKQPPWSDLPLIILTVAGEVSRSTGKRFALREPLGNVLLLERPIRPETLISTVETTLRARRRQYQIRDHLEQFKQAQAALRQSEKLAVAGRLTASIAHEINNPLESVTNLLYLMRSSSSLEEIKEYLELAEPELARVSQIATQTLKFYRQPSAATPISVAEALNSALLLYRQRLASAKIAVERQIEEAPPIQGVAGELRQVFVNLIDNAVDAMRMGGRLKLRLRPAKDLLNGGQSGVRVLIADTGSGIPREVQSKLFLPFISTKPTTGTGLGLWVASEIIQKHGGNIRVRSSVAAGRSCTIFSIFLPGSPCRSPKATG